jgi:hypothetical protein
MANLSMASTRDVMPNNGYKKLEKPVVGKDEVPIIFLFHMGTPKIDAAIEDALNNNNAEYLTDIKVTSKVWAIPLIYGRRRVEVEGTAWVKE